jgi:mono/diheme cytochrome c family protein
MMPALPRLSDAETSALISWMRSLPVSAGEAEGVSFRPIGRVAILTGKLVPIASIPEEQRTQMPVDVGAAHAGGRRMASLVCSVCHGPTLLGQGMQEGAVAPDLAIVAAYNLDQFRTLMRTGKGLGDRELGEMSAVARDSLSSLTDSEIEALHAYLVARSQRLRP